MHDSDRTLARRMHKGSDAAYRAFFDEYFPRLYRFCTRRLGELEAEEVTQTVLADAIRGIGNYRGEASLFTWLCQMARYQISAYYRQRERRPHLVAVEDSPEARAELESLGAEEHLAPEAHAVSDETQALVQLILDHLPGDYGRILEWKYMYGYSVEEIATRLGSTAVSVQSKLARAREAFRDQHTALRATTAPVKLNKP